MEIDQFSNPYELIKKLNNKIKQQNEIIKTYKKIIQNSQNQKIIISNELMKKQQNLDKLKNQIQKQRNQTQNTLCQFQNMKRNLWKTTKLQNNKTLKVNQLNSPQNQIISQQFFRNYNSSKNINQQNKNNLFLNVPIKILQENNQNNFDFIPKDVKLIDRKQKNPLNSTTNFWGYQTDQFGQTFIQQNKQFIIAQFFLQDFFIIGPDISELKKKRDNNRKIDEFILNPVILFDINSKLKLQVSKQIANRCFPSKIVAKKQIISSFQQLEHIIQFSPSNKISNDYFVINLRKQQHKQKNSNFLNPCFKKSNLNQCLFIFILKVPDFILIQKDQRNYQRTQQQVWIVQKCYALATYYPFFNILIKILTKIHEIHIKEKLRKIFIQKEKFYTFDLRQNVTFYQKNQEIQQILNFFKKKSIDFGEVIYHKNVYYGTIPNNGQNIQHALTKICAPIFMSSFSYQEMLLLITGILCEKSIILMSKYQGLATFCALYLTSVVNPFPMDLILLNIDQNKMETMIFQVPFPMVATVKRTSSNTDSIIYQYVSAQISKKDIRGQSQRIIFVDIDSRSIVYHGRRQFESLIINPNEQLFTQYTKFNPSFSKNFSFPKKLTKQNQDPYNNKKKQQIKKNFKQLSQKIQTNQIKFLTFQSNKQVEIILSLLIQYLKSFVIEGQALNQAFLCLQQNNNNRLSYYQNTSISSNNNINSKPKTYHEILREFLLKRHPDKAELIQVIINSQYYANYLSFSPQ